MNVNEILNKSRKNLESDLKTNQGTKKESIYKESIFEGLNAKEKKSSRKKIRNFVHSIFESLLTYEKEKNKAKFYFKSYFFNRIFGCVVSILCWCA